MTTMFRLRECERGDDFDLLDVLREDLVRPPDARAMGALATRLAAAERQP